MPGAGAVAYRKLLANQGGEGTIVATASAKEGKKARKLSSTFSSLKSRQRIVERVKRAIWASVLDINDAIINLALCGNYNAAKALFDFAGVYTLPGPEEAAAAARTAVSEAAVEAVDPIDAFFKSIGVSKSVGVEPGGGEPQPEAA
jgi:hypothetical protein